MALYGHRGLKFTPGERFEYSNYGFILAGVLIEKVSGMSYYDYVRKHIFEPAGMTDTGSLSEEESVEKRSSAALCDTMPIRSPTGALRLGEATRRWEICSDSPGLSSRTGC